jgi:hypothetical protein
MHLQNEAKANQIAVATYSTCYEDILLVQGTSGCSKLKFVPRKLDDELNF